MTTDAEHAAALRHELNPKAWRDGHHSSQVRAAIERAIYVLKHWEWMDGYARDEWHDDTPVLADADEPDGPVL